MFSKKPQNIDPRSVVNKSIEIFKHCRTRRLLHISIIIGIGIENESTEQVEEQRMIIKLVIGLEINICKDKSTTKNNLSVSQQENEENESLKVKLLISSDAQSVAHSQDEIAKSSCQPVDHSRLFGTKELKRYLR